MLSQEFKDILLKVPGARQVKNHLLKQGHTDYEAEVGALFTSTTVLVVLVILLNSFIFGVIKQFFNSLWVYCGENPSQAIVIGLLATMIFLGVLFQLLRKSSAKKAEKKYQERRE